jgi:hypothetical protein
VNEPDSERTFVRHELDRTNADRLSRLEQRLDNVDLMVRRELSSIDDRIKNNLEQIEMLIAERAVDMAVHRAFAHLGVDVDDPKDLQRFRDDLRFGGVFRSAAMKGFFAILAAICGGIGLSVWLAFKARLGFQ